MVLQELLYNVGKREQGLLMIILDVIMVYHIVQRSTRKTTIAEEPGKKQTLADLKDWNVMFFIGIVEPMAESLAWK